MTPAICPGCWRSLAGASARRDSAGWTWPPPGAAEDLSGCEVESGAGEEAAEQAGPVLHPFEPGLYHRRELGDVVLGEVGQRSFQVRPHQLDRVELAGIGRKLVDGQP